MPWNPYSALPTTFYGIGLLNFHRPQPHLPSLSPLFSCVFLACLDKRRYVVFVFQPYTFQGKNTLILSSNYKAFEPKLQEFYHPTICISTKNV